MYCCVIKSAMSAWLQCHCKIFKVHLSVWVILFHWISAQWDSH